MRFGAPAGTGATLLVGEGIETVLSLVAAVPALPAGARTLRDAAGCLNPPPGGPAPARGRNRARQVP